MSGGKSKKKRDVGAELEAARVVEDAFRAVLLRRTGTPWGQIADQLGRPVYEVEELAKIGYEKLLGQMDPDTIRAEVEDRQDAIIRQANLDLAQASTIGERNMAYRTILAADAARVKLLGLQIKAGVDDA